MRTPASTPRPPALPPPLCERPSRDAPFGGIAACDDSRGRNPAQVTFSLPSWAITLPQMPAPRRDPYETLGVGPDVTDDKLRSVYRHLVQQHHPDHNGGSPEAARRFEEVQDAYQRIRRQREQASRAARTPPPPPVDPAVESRLADLERELRQAHEARERARRAAQEAAAASSERPSDEELGYIKTDDSLARIVADAS